MTRSVKNKKPFAYSVALEVDGKLLTVENMPVLWDKKSSKALASELKKLTKLRFIAVDIHIKKLLDGVK